MSESLNDDRATHLLPYQRQAHRPLPLPALQPTQGAATMRRTLSILHTVDQHGQPLAVIDDLAGLLAEMYPSDLRQFARTINTAANDLEQGERGLVVYCIQE